MARPADVFILGIETSCDETSAAVVRSGEQVLSNVVSSQFAAHRPYEGVVPELASREHLRNTVRSETGALRGTLIRATLAQEERDYAQAIPLYEQIIAADRHFIIEVLPPLMACHRAAGSLAEFDAYLGRLLAKDPSLHRDLAYAAVLADLDGSAVLRSAVERFVFEHPVLGDLVNAAELKSLPEEQRRLAIGRIAHALRTIALANARYRCANCGYSTQRFIWHCPSCKLWETVRPIQSVPLDTVLTPT